MFGFRELEDIYKEEFPPKKEFMIEKLTDEQKLEKVMGGNLFYDILQDEKSKSFITQVQLNGDDYNDKLEEVKERVFIYVGDELGFIKLWDLTEILASSGVAKTKRVIELKTAFNPNRQETVDCSTAAEHIRKSLRQKPPAFP